MKSRPIKQTIIFKADPHDVYETLMDSKKHSAFSGDKASISRKEGEKIKAYGEYIIGKNLELASGKKIVQEWRAADWAQGIISKATFSLKKVKGGTKLSFTQTGVPSNHYAAIKKGWIDFYWKPMKKFLEK